MNDEHVQLLDRLRRFDLDAGDQPLSFSRRLARENGWSRAYALRVCEEYKRFAFLAATAGPCTPSDQVDQAWHLHLLHTEAYWSGFCSQVLRVPLHHGPTRGGRQEMAKFRDLYSRTLQRYRDVFREPPPADIWPCPSERFAASYLRVDRNEAFILPRPRLRSCRPELGLVAAALTALAVAGCSLAQRAGSGLEALPGLGHLVPFLLLWGACWGLIVGLRRRAARAPSPPPEIDPYLVALMSDGPRRDSRLAGGWGC